MKEHFLHSSTSNKETETDLEISKDDDDEEELAIIAWKFKRFMRKKKFENKASKKKEAEEDGKKGVTRYHYKKLNHIKMNCPLLKKNQSNSKRKKKVMMVKWSDLDVSNKENSGDKANLCLMANES